VATPVDFGKIGVPAISHFTAERQEIIRETDELRAELQNLRIAVNSAKSGDEKTKDDIEDEIRILQAAFRAKEAESNYRRAQVAVETEEALAQKRIIERDMSRLQRELATIELTVREIVAKRDSAQIEEGQLARRAQQNEELVRTSTERLSQLKEQIAVGDATRSTLLREINEAKHLKENEAKINEEILAGIARLKSDLHKVEREVEDVSKNNSDLLKIEEELKTKISTSQIRSGEIISDLAAKEELVKEAKSTLEAIVAEITDKEAAKSILLNAIAETRHIKENEGRISEELLEETRKAKNTLQDLKSEISNSSRENSELLKTEEKLRLSIASIREKEIEISAEIGKREELARAASESLLTISEQVRQGEEKRSSLLREISETRDVKENERKINEGLLNAIEKSQAVILDLELSARSLMGKCSELQITENAATQRLADTRAIEQELISTIESLSQEQKLMKESFTADLDIRRGEMEREFSARKLAIDSDIASSTAQLDRIKFEAESAGQKILAKAEEAGRLIAENARIRDESSIAAIQQRGLAFEDSLHMKNEALNSELSELRERQEAQLLLFRESVEKDLNERRGKLDFEARSFLENQEELREKFRRELEAAELLVASTTRAAQERSRQIVEAAQIESQQEKVRIEQDLKEFRENSERDARKNLDAVTLQAHDLKLSSDTYARETRERTDKDVAALRIRVENEIRQAVDAAQTESAAKIDRNEKDAFDRLQLAERELNLKYRDIELQIQERRDSSEKASSRLIEDTNAKVEIRITNAESRAKEITAKAEVDVREKLESVDREIEALRVETKSKVDSLVHASEEQARQTIEKANGEGIRAKEAAAEVFRDLESRAKLHADELVGNAKKASDEVRREMEQYGQSVRKSTEEYSEGRRQLADKEYQQAKSGVEQQLAVMKLREMELLKVWKKEQTEEFFLKRRHETSEVVRNLEVVISKKIGDILANPQNPESIRAIGPEVINIAKQVLNGEQAQQNMSRIQELLPFSPRGAKKVRVFWYKVLAYSFIAITLAVALFVYPGYWDPLKAYASDYFSGKKASGDVYVDKEREERKRKSAFNPKQSPAYKGSYTDNVLYTENFIHYYTEDPVFQGKWIRELNKFFDKDLELDDKIVVKFIPLEETLVRKLIRLKASITPATKDVGVGKMRAEEKDSLEKMKKLLSSSQDYEKFSAFRKSFYEEYKKVKVKE
jgi:hypothetical protein